MPPTPSINGEFRKSRIPQPHAAPIPSASSPAPRVPPTTTPREKRKSAIPGPSNPALKSRVASSLLPIPAPMSPAGPSSSPSQIFSTPVSASSSHHTTSSTSPGSTPGTASSSTSGKARSLQPSFQKRLAAFQAGKTTASLGPSSSPPGVAGAETSPDTTASKFEGESGHTDCSFRDRLLIYEAAEHAGVQADKAQLERDIKRLQERQQNIMSLRDGVNRIPWLNGLGRYACRNVDKPREGRLGCWAMSVKVIEDGEEDVEYDEDKGEYEEEEGEEEELDISGSPSAWLRRDKGKQRAVEPVEGRAGKMPIRGLKGKEERAVGPDTAAAEALECDYDEDCQEYNHTAASVPSLETTLTPPGPLHLGTIEPLQWHDTVKQFLPIATNAPDAFPETTRRPVIEVDQSPKAQETRFWTGYWTRRTAQLREEAKAEMKPLIEELDEREEAREREREMIGGVEGEGEDGRVGGENNMTLKQLQQQLKAKLWIVEGDGVAGSLRVQ